MCVHPPVTHDHDRAPFVGTLKCSLYDVQFCLFDFSISQLSLYVCCDFMTKSVQVSKKQGSLMINSETLQYEGGSESSVIGVITLLIYMIGCCIIP